MLPLLAALVLAPLQPTQDPVKARLEGSPRHHEWIEVKVGERVVRTFAVFPEVKAKVQAVVVIHENKGLNDWARSVADRLAEAGYLALAPDLLSGSGPEGGGSESFASPDEATKAIYALDAARVRADLDAVVAHARTLPACGGKVSVAGFCWGGARSFDYATHAKDLVAAYVFYGSAPSDPASLGTIACPVYGFYGENDARITAGVEATAAAMEQAGKTFDFEVYPGAGHGFLRSGEAADASPENRKAFEEGWKRWRELLAR
ncbi:MAG TPA: dienelactone hydrolase family protein [Planctomycetota bacterium]